ncbi:ABC transporter permease [Leifsonia sp. PS1209]|uniref:ABC transporter permease n=1 Tax=Leifsonia sp. PS1209 TaxID=2724914 RepID=UPI001442B43C|nr:ABC transporter permease [Leifsonia sp. PS1209]QIZ97588.1 ABC transporter permease [Leifsonia sp. PS1209]
MYLSGLFGFRALFAWNSPGLFVATLVVTPVMQVLFFVTLGAAFDYQNASFFVIGNAVQVAAAAGISGMVSVIADERQIGTLSSIIGSPSSSTTVFIGRTLPGVVLGFLVSALTAVLGFSLTGSPIPPDHLLLFALVLAVAAFSCTALGLFLSALGLLYRDIYQIAGAAYLLLLIVSGANFLRQDLPGWVQLLGGVLPQAHAIDAARSLAVGVGAGSAWASTLLEFVVGVGWLLLALVGMKVLESLARKRATLDLY